MPKRISAAKRKRVIDLWRNGEGLQEIASKLGISLGSVHGIINGERAAVPDIEELRELGLSLREAGVSLEEAKEGADLLQTIKETRDTVG